MASGSFQSCKVDILEMDVIVLKTGDAKRLAVRETDYFERRNGEWKLIHQHASVPSGGDWNGKVTTA
jgi:ketosteroid isomerase-like protein